MKTFFSHVTFLSRNNVRARVAYKKLNKMKALILDYLFKIYIYIFIFSLKRQLNTKCAVKVRFMRTFCR